MRQFSRAAMFVFLVVSCLAAQKGTMPQAAKRMPPPGPLHSVTVKGSHLYAASDIAKESGLTPGERVDPKIIEAARQRLNDTELFANVAYEYRTTPAASPGYDVTFDVQDITQLFPTRFERLGSSDAALRSCLRAHVPLYSDKIPGTEGVLQRYKAAVQQCAAQDGKSPGVRAAVSNDDPQQLAVLFTPDIPVPTIAQVVVSGNQAVDTGSILRAVNSVAIGAPLSDSRIKMILDGAIKPLYAAKGYAAVTFPKVDTEPSKSNLGVVLKVQILDGPAFKFGAIRFRGRGLEEEEIRSAIPFKPGQAFNSEQVDNFRLGLVKKMRRRGLLDASITTETQPDDTQKVVNVIYNVTPGATYNFHTLNIQGLDITSEPVIAKLWGEKDGHPFNPEYPDFFLKKVEEQGIFDNLKDARSDYTADESTHNVTVHLYFKGGESAKEHDRKKKEEEEKRQSDGSWSPY